MALAGKKVLITGSSHGIGAATAIAFAKDGCQVGVNYNKTPDGAQATAQEIEKLGQKTKIYKADVSDPVQCESMVLDFIRDFGGIDVLINNAGGALQIPPGEFVDMPIEYWNNQIDLNLNAAAYTAKHALKYMIENKVKGKIINVSSVHSIVTWVKRKMLPYAPAKAGLNMLTKALACEVAKYGINVNAIAPGFIMTKLSYRYTPEQMDAFKRKIPLGQLGNVNDITPMMLFLADDEKSHFITGQTFVIDGGQSIDGAIDSMMYDF
ncbi:MAG: SDR family oxidoreductase [Lentisphaerae bacterium]|jgi:3-oxoacyl-[acyl-carrier protein] reductase|nr:SDR family oxidoreductase [Lentisphaerota bacterium]